jgi:hypothetical protein
MGPGWSRVSGIAADPRAISTSRGDFSRRVVDDWAAAVAVRAVTTAAAHRSNQRAEEERPAQSRSDRIRTVLRTESLLSLVCRR